MYDKLIYIYRVSLKSQPFNPLWLEISRMAENIRNCKNLPFLGQLILGKKMFGLGQILKGLINTSSSLKIGPL